jgi:hypothetical protein
LSVLKHLARAVGERMSDGPLLTPAVKQVVAGLIGALVVGWTTGWLQWVLRSFIG